jgi:hypothetical protein
MMKIIKIGDFIKVVVTVVTNESIIYVAQVTNVWRTDSDEINITAVTLNENITVSRNFKDIIKLTNEEEMLIRLEYA